MNMDRFCPLMMILIADVISSPWLETKERCEGIVQCHVYQVFFLEVYIVKRES